MSWAIKELNVESINQTIDEKIPEPEEDIDLNLEEFPEEEEDLVDDPTFQDLLKLALQ